MQALHFGDPARLLFGCHHPAAGGARQSAVLICPSWGLEHTRSYRGLRLLAQRLAIAGFETLRFDYSCTGDSQGHSLDAKLDDWLVDIGVAAQELRDLSGRQHIAVIGLRLGALLADAARLSMRLQPRLLVHWDAPESGARYVELMRTLSTGSDEAKRWRRHSSAWLPAPADNELNGHAWPAPLAAAITALPATAVAASSQWLVSSDQTSPTQAPASSIIASGEPGHWQDLPWVNTPWAPTAVAARLVTHLGTVLP